MRLVADLFFLLGAVFCFIAAVGLLRMPDSYNRIQVSTKSATLGALALLIAVGLLYPQWWAKLLCIAGFLLFTSPVSSSVLARALYRSGVKPWERHGETTASDNKNLLQQSENEVAS